MANPVRIAGGNIDGDTNEGYHAQVDQNGNLRVREGHFDGDNQSYEDTSFVTGDSPATHDFYTDTGGRCSVDGWVVCDGDGDISVSISRDGISYGDAMTMKSGEIIDLLRWKVNKIRVTWIADSAYRIVLI